MSRFDDANFYRRMARNYSGFSRSDFEGVADIQGGSTGSGPGIVQQFNDLGRANKLIWTSEWFTELGPDPKDPDKWKEIHPLGVHHRGVPLSRLFAEDARMYLDPLTAKTSGTASTRSEVELGKGVSAVPAGVGSVPLSKAPAPITEAPTSTSYPPRPRTVAAGYDRAREVLTVIFRDGTYYNYYGVAQGNWDDFVSAKSKGRYIKMFLDGKTRGPADISDIADEHRELLYLLSRTVQIAKGGLTGTQTWDPADAPARSTISKARSEYKGSYLNPDGAVKEPVMPANQYWHGYTPKYIREAHIPGTTRKFGQLNRYRPRYGKAAPTKFPNYRP